MLFSPFFYTDSKNETYSYTYDEEYEHRVTSAYIEALKTGFFYEYDGGEDNNDDNNYGNVTKVQMKALDDEGNIKTDSPYLESSTGYNLEYTVDEEGNEVVDTQKSGNYVTSVTDQSGNTTYYTVNTTTGLTNSVTDAENNVVSYTYYTDSFLPWTVSSDRISGGTTSTETVTYIYDDYNRLDTITHNGFDYGFNYDDFGNTTSITVADRTLVTNVYADNNGYLEEKEYGNGTVYTYTYDKYGRVTSVAVNGTTKFNTVYNKKGQVAYIYDIANNRKLVYTYDISGRVLSLTYTGYATISTTYDDADRPIGVTYTFAGEEKSLTFGYEAGSLKGNAVLISGDTRTVVYDDLSRETSTTVGNAYTREITYVSAGGNRTTTLPESVTYTKNSVALFSESYQYDDIGNIEFVTNNGVTTTYFYDSLNQLTKASSSDGTVTKYFYNDGGNINYKVNADGSKTHYVYDTEWKDLLVGFGGQSITYDTIGNPINYLGNTMSWTGRTLDSITKADGTQISYTYDLDGIRTKKVVGGVTTEYFVNGTTILAQKTGENIIWYIYDSDGEILGFTYNNVAYYYVKNLQGDVLKVIDTNGNVVASYTYDPWGKLLTATGTMAEINPIRYRGYYYDSETGLYYLNSRYYDPDTCRFINADGYVTTGQGLVSFNMFVYCLNNPVNMVDSFGTDAILILESKSVWPFGHIGLLVESSSGRWRYFYWGSGACFFELVNVRGVNLYEVDGIVEVLHRSEDPDISPRASKVTNIVYLEGDYTKTYEYLSGLDKTREKNKNYKIGSRNCSQETFTALSKSNHSFASISDIISPKKAFQKASLLNAIQKTIKNKEKERLRYRYIAMLQIIFNEREVYDFV